MARVEGPTPKGPTGEPGDTLCADFGYPVEISGLVRYVPVGPDEPTDMDIMVGKWRK